MAKDKSKPMQAKPRLRTRTDLGEDATRDVSAGLALLLADVFALYLKTKNFHWHVSGPHFRDFHLMLDEQADQIFAMTDPIAERARKLGGTTLRSIGDIARHQRIPDNDADYVDPQDMLAELAEDNRQFVSELRSLHATCSEHSWCLLLSQLPLIFLQTHLYISHRRSTIPYPAHK
jgi:starvation-inducible DNA-binding protein